MKRQAVRLAIVHDYLNQYGGAERVLEELHTLFPEAPIFTSMFDPGALPASFQSMDIRTSFMQRLPLVTRYHQPFLPLYPLAFESLDLRGFDVVLSNSSAFAKGVVTPPETLHVCYCLTPMRFAWSYREYVEREQLGPLARFVLPPLIHWLRLWDVASSARVDRFVAISRVVQARIHKHYRRESEIIYPPVDTDRVRPNHQPPEDFFLVVSRLIPYKRIDLAVEAFNKLGLPLVIVGDGRDRPALEAKARPNVRFLGRQPDEVVRDLLARCRAFIFPGEEDFGIAPVEAQAAGRPVIAYAGGGALDTVVDGVTGLLFREKSPEALAEVVDAFDPAAFDPVAIRHHAERFSTATFRRRLLAYVEQSLDRHWQAVPRREPATASPPGATGEPLVADGSSSPASFEG